MPRATSRKSIKRRSFATPLIVPRRPHRNYLKIRSQRRPLLPRKLTRSPAIPIS